MNVKWLIQEDVFSEKLDLFIAKLNEKSIEYHIAKYVPFSDELDTPFNDDDCVITFGSLNLAKQVRRTKKWVPGVFCDLQNFRCLTYFPFYGKYLLNSKYFFLNLLELQRRKDEILDFFGGQFFIRPDRGDKPFAGHVVASHSFDSDINFLLNYNQIDNIVMVSKAVNINKEYRFIVVEDKVITGSQYKVSGELDLQEFSNGLALEYAQSILNKDWRPDPAFVIDVCEVDGKFYLLELNSFSCSGIYASNQDIIIDEISKLAIREWQELKG